MIQRHSLQTVYGGATISQLYSFLLLFLCKTILP